jgi:tetratricopeptide (TPR) repeat protein
MLLLTNLIAAALLAGPGAPAGGVPTTIAVVSSRAERGPRTAQDSAETLYRAGRDAMARGDYRRAAELFDRIGERFPSSSQASNALYWRAFALYRVGGTSELRRARTSLATLREKGSETYKSDAASLDTRICGELARRGDAQCAETVEKRADSLGIARAVGEVARAASVMAADAVRAAGEATANALRDPDVQAALTEARVTAGAAVRAGVDEATRAASDAVRGASAGLRDADRSMREASRDLARSSRRSSSDCEEDDDDVKVIALNALLQMDADRALPLLKKVMASREKCSEVLRKKAVFLIAQKQRAPEAADLLVEAAKNDPDVDVRKEALFWLSRVNGDKAIELLRDVALKPGDPEMRKQAVFSLSQNGSATARETLRQIATTPNADAEVRGDAIFWLGQRGSAEDMDFLRTLYPKLESRDLKDKVLFAASRHRGNGAWLLDVANDTKETTELRKQALFWAGQGGVPVEQLVALYDRTTDQEMKKQLVFVYQQKNGGPAFEKLLDIARNEKDTEVRKDAIFWISRSKDPRATKLIEDLLNK